MFWKLYLAHLIADFVLQNNDLARRKSSVKHTLTHSLIVCVVSLLFLIGLWSLRALCLVLFISFLHGIIDYIKAKLVAKLDSDWYWILFTGDQILHILIIILGLSLFYPLFGLAISQKAQVIYDSVPLYRIFSFALLLTVGGSYFTAAICKKFTGKVNNQDIGESLQDAGKYIGVLERIIVAASILSGRYELIGFLIAAKSIIRHGEQSNKGFTEYFLIGTFSSLAWASMITILYILS